MSPPRRNSGTSDTAERGPVVAVAVLSSTDSTGWAMARLSFLGFGIHSRIPGQLVLIVSEQRSCANITIVVSGGQAADSDYQCVDDLFKADSEWECLYGLP